VNSRALAITAVAVVATAISVVIGARAIMGTASTLRHTTGATEAVPGELERTGSEVELLLDDMAMASETGDPEDTGRDPMVPYKEPRKTSSTPKPPAKPRGPSYKVSAVVIDEQDPTAVLLVNGESHIVRVGDRVEGGRVVAIEREGVTIEGDDGQTKLYQPSE
jgi:hypothetical protein